MSDEWRASISQVMACDQEFCDLCRCPLEATGGAVTLAEGES